MVSVVFLNYMSNFFWIKRVETIKIVIFVGTINSTNSY